MSIHQLNLRGGSEKKQREVDTKAIVRYLDGEISLADAVKIDEKTADGLRRQAQALFEAGKWQQCIDVILGLAAIGDVDPLDPLLMADAYSELGNTEAAELCTKMGENMLSALGAILETIEQEKTE